MFNYAIKSLPWVVPVVMTVLVILALSKVVKSATLGMRSILEMFRLALGASDILKSEASKTPRQLQNLTIRAESPPPLGVGWIAQA